MIINIGIYHPFDFVDGIEKVNDKTIYSLNSIDIILTEEVVSAVLISETGTQTVLTLSNKSHDIGGNTIKSCRITGSILGLTSSYYMKIEYVKKVGTSIIYSDGLIQYTACTAELQSLNNCSNEYYDWDNDASPQVIKIPKYAAIPPTFVEEKTTIYADGGRVELVKSQTKIFGFEFLGPTSWFNLLNGVKLNNTNQIKDEVDGLVSIKNLQVEKEEQGDGTYSIFNVTYEEDTNIKGSTCCEIINIDVLASPDYTGGGTCGLFAVTIGESAGILTPTPTDAPVGTLTYRWYKNGVYLANSTTIAITDSGNYKVEAKVGQCVVSSTYYSPDECALFQLNTSLSNNDISATVSNVPAGETASYVIKKDGITVSSSVPYTAVASGTYFVHATAGNCTQIKGVYVLIVTPTADFTLSITQADGLLTAITDASAPTYLWELESFNESTGTSSLQTIGTSSTQLLSSSGIYHLSITEGLNTKTVYYFFQTGMNVRVTNLIDIANASGDIQVIENTTGNTFDLDYDPSRWLIMRNGIDMTYKIGVAAGSLEVNEYDVINGQLVTSSVFPLTINDRIEIKPV